MRLLLHFLTAICLLVSFFACSPPTPRDPFAYAAAPFSLSAEGTYLPANDPEGSPRPFAARVTAGAPIGGDPTLRDLTLTFTAPAALSGVTVTAALTPAADGPPTRTVTFSYPSDYGTVTFTAKGDELDGLLRFAEGWLPAGDVSEVSPKAADGNYTVTRRTAEGEAVFAFREGNDLPVTLRLTDGHGSVEMSVSRGGERGGWPPTA